MELDSKYYTISITVEELLKYIPSNIWENVQGKLLIVANKEYATNFKNIDFVDSEGKLSFGVFD